MLHNVSSDEDIRAQIYNRVGWERLQKEDALMAPIAVHLAGLPGVYPIPDHTYNFHFSMTLATQMRAYLTANAILDNAPPMTFCNDAGVLITACFAGNQELVLRLLRTPDQDPCLLLWTLFQHYKANRQYGVLCFLQEVISLYVPLSARCWDIVPYGCPNLLRALPSTLERGTSFDKHNLFKRFQRRDAEVVQCALLSINRVHRHLPSDILNTILMYTFR